MDGCVILDEPAIAQFYVAWGGARESVESCTARLADQLRLAVETVIPAAIRARIAALPSADRKAAHAGADLIWQHMLAAIAQSRCVDATACSAAALETLNLRATR